MTEPTPDTDEVSESMPDAEDVIAHRADRPPTPEEEAKAEGNVLDPSVAEAYKEAAETGANVEGEGAIE